LHALISNLHGVEPEVRENTTSVERRETPELAEQSQKKQKIWDRPILKNVPAIVAFGKKSSKERGEDRETSRRMSIATGAVARGRAQNVTNEMILDAILEAWDDEDQLRDLYKEDIVDAAKTRKLAIAAHQATTLDQVSKPVKPILKTGLMDKKAVELNSINEALKRSAQESGIDPASVHLLTELPRTVTESAPKDASSDEPTKKTRWGDESSSEEGPGIPEPEVSVPMNVDPVEEVGEGGIPPEPGGHDQPPSSTARSRRKRGRDPKSH